MTFKLKDLGKRANKFGSDADCREYRVEVSESVKDFD
jgi:hypothetical protein